MATDEMESKVSIRSMLKLLDTPADLPETPPAVIDRGPQLSVPRAVRSARTAVDEARTKRDVAAAKLTLAVAAFHDGTNKNQTPVYACQVELNTAEAVCNEARKALTGANDAWLPDVAAALAPTRAEARAKLVAACREIVAAHDALRTASQLMVRQGLVAPEPKDAYAILNLRQLAAEIIAND